MSYMSPEQEVEVIRARVPECEKALARTLVKVAMDVREARENDQVYCTFPTRRLIELARKHAQLGDFSAALNRLADADRQVVFEICQRHLGKHLAQHWEG